MDAPGFVLTASQNADFVPWRQWFPQRFAHDVHLRHEVADVCDGERQVVPALAVGSGQRRNLGTRLLAPPSVSLVHPLHRSCLPSLRWRFLHLAQVDALDLRQEDAASFDFAAATWLVSSALSACPKRNCALSTKRMLAGRNDVPLSALRKSIPNSKFGKMML